MLAADHWDVVLFMTMDAAWAQQAVTASAHVYVIHVV